MSTGNSSTSQDSILNYTSVLLKITTKGAGVVFMCIHGHSHVSICEVSLENWDIKIASLQGNRIFEGSEKEKVKSWKKRMEKRYWSATTVGSIGLRERESRCQRQKWNQGNIIEVSTNVWILLSRRLCYI